MRRNIFVAFTGLATLAVGMYLLLEHHFMRDDPSDRLVHISQYMGNINWAVILMVVGTVAAVVGLTNYNKYHAYSVMIIILSALWCAYFVAFLIQDIHFGQPIRLGTVLTGYVFVQILVEARFGGGGR